MKICSIYEGILSNKTMLPFSTRLSFLLYIWYYCIKYNGLKKSEAKKERKSMTKGKERKFSKQYRASQYFWQTGWSFKTVSSWILHQNIFESLSYYLNKMK